jgi:hypothetical protein
MGENLKRGLGLLSVPRAEEYQKAEVNLFYEVRGTEKRLKK